MKLQTIEVTDFRSISHLRHPCKPGINVIAGINGAGKSTLLEAIEIMLSWVKARIRLKNAPGSYPTFSDIRRGASFTQIGVTAITPETICWEVTRTAPGYRGNERHKSDLSDMTGYADRLASEYHSSAGKENLPMFVKYSVNRSLIDIPAHVHKKHILDAMALYEGRIDGGSNLRSFFEWFREREDIEREEREELRSFDYEDPQLKVVRRAISSVMQGYGDLHTRRKAPAGFELRKNGMSFRVEELSDGEKCYLTLIGDISRRLAICNPTLENPLEGNGIILIDELELHLHPSWQGESIDKLRATFPNCQFFITTHSPHIIQNLQLDKDDNLIVICNGETHHVGARYGSPIDEVLNEVFMLDSLRPAPVAHAIETVWNLLENGTYEGAALDEAISRLRALITANDMEFVDINKQIALNKKNCPHASDK